MGEELDAHRKRVLAQHPGLSLTAMYNVLDKLRAAAPRNRNPDLNRNPPSSPEAEEEERVRLRLREGEEAALTVKEQATHDAGLVSVLRQLHDELDAAVAAAYGWVRAARADGKPEPENLSDPEILARLVALNAACAAEEAAGQVRWLRPEFQAPAGAGARQAGLNLATRARITRRSEPAGAGVRRAGLNLPDKAGPKPETQGPGKREPWPKPLADRVAAVERALREAVAPVTPAQLARRFLRAQPADLAEILETLATLGRAQREGDRFSS